MKYLFRFLMIVAILPLMACQSDKEELTISSAASLNEGLNEVISSFEEAHPNIEISVNVGGSGALSQQIIHGASIDMLLSASMDHFNRVKQEGLIDEKWSTTLLSNKLVWITPRNVSPPHEIREANRIAMGTPEIVPAGQYAKQSLQNLNVYSSIKDKLVFTKDVRQVVQYVESESADIGIVYQTDAYLSEKVTIHNDLPLGLHEPIEYPIGILKESENKNSARKFYNFLQSEEALTIFENYGFSKADEE